MSGHELMLHLWWDTTWRLLAGSRSRWWSNLVLILSLTLHRKVKLIHALNHFRSDDTLTDHILSVLDRLSQLRILVTHIVHPPRIAGGSQHRHESIVEWKFGWVDTGHRHGHRRRWSSHVHSGIHWTLGRWRWSNRLSTTALSLSCLSKNVHRCRHLLLLLGCHAVCARWKDRWRLWRTYVSRLTHLTIRVHRCWLVRRVASILS